MLALLPQEADVWMRIQKPGLGEGRGRATAGALRSEQQVPAGSGSEDGDRGEDVSCGRHGSGGARGGRPGSPAKSYLQIKALGTTDPGTRVLRSPQSSPRKAAGPVSTGRRLRPPPSVPDVTRHKPPF